VENSELARKTRAPNKLSDERFVVEDHADSRSPAQVDRDRILYSTAFARLAEVTQVVAAERGHVFHNRLTHSIKVGQLARRLAEKLLREQPEEAAALGGLDPDVAEAAGLAHDLGHPPFGHIAEETLHRLVQKKGKLMDGFEGNAQSFRIVAKLAVSDALPKTGAKTIEGLNLTRATLNGILKYPWLYNQNVNKKNKWGAYRSEEILFDWVRSRQPFGGFAKSIEAELMDWADDITFAIHDLVDFFCAGQIPLERLGDESGSAEREAFFREVLDRNPELRDRRSSFEDAFATIVELFVIDRRYTGTVKQRRHIWQLSTVLISRFADAIRLRTGQDESPVSIDQYAKDQIRVLKELTWHYVILHHELATGQHGQQRIIETLFTTLLDAAHSRKQWKLFPVSLQERLEEHRSDPAIVRIVTDHLASMTEKEASRQFRALSGAA
jgi:dGTPase